MQFFTIHADQLVYLLKQICSQVVVNFQRHQHDLIRVYFASHLAAPIGFRKDTTANESGGDDDEVDLSIDEDDQIAYEDSLFAIGQFSSASPERDTLGNVVGMLAGLLEQRVCALLQPGNEANPSFALLEDIHWADLTLKLSSRTLHCGAKSVSLGFKEFEVLKLLLANPRGIVSKEELLVKVWGSDSNAEDNNVEAYISFLRKKFFYLGSRAGIGTVRKVGYHLEEN